MISPCFHTNLVACAVAHRQGAHRRHQRHKGRGISGEGGGGFGEGVGSCSSAAIPPDFFVLELRRCCRGVAWGAGGRGRGLNSATLFRELVQSRVAELRVAYVFGWCRETRSTVVCVRAGDWQKVGPCVSVYVCHVLGFCFHLFSCRIIYRIV